MGRKYCPDCRSILSSVVLLSNFDTPNEFRTNTYLCCKCSRKSGMVCVFSFSYTKLAEFKEKGKFPAAVKYTKKLVNYLKSKNQSFLHEDRIPKKFCYDCKEKLFYDRDASNLKLSVVKIRTYFHFDCKNNDQHQLMFFFIKQRIENVVINRIIVG